MKCELPDVQVGFRKGKGSRDLIANMHWIIEKAREFQKKIYLCFIDYAKAFKCVYHKKLWKIHQEMGIWDHLTCLLRNLYAGQEATVRIGHGKAGTGSKLGMEYVKAIYCHPLICRVHHWNGWLDVAQAGIKIAGRNINNFSYADDTTLMEESKELKSLLKVKEENENVGLKLNIQKWIMVSSPITSWQIDGETMQRGTDFIFLGSKITAYGDCSDAMKRCLLLGRKAMTKLDSVLKAVTLLCKKMSV